MWLRAHYKMEPASLQYFLLKRSSKPPSGQMSYLSQSIVTGLLGEPNTTSPLANPFASFVRAALMIKYVTMRLRIISVAFRNVLPAVPCLPP